MTRHELPIREYELDQKVNVGIALRSEGGVVPEYECREAAVFGHYSWRQWLALPCGERAENIAHYRMHNLIEAHTHDAVDKYQERQAAMARQGSN